MSILNFWKKEEPVKEKIVEKVNQPTIIAKDNRNERMNDLYKEIDEYLQKIYALNFAPNKERIEKKISKSSQKIKNDYEKIFGGYKNIDTYDEFKNYLTVNNPKIIKPKILYDYLNFANSVSIKHTSEKNIGFEFTRFNGETFKEFWKSGKIQEVADTRVEWTNRTMELMIKVVPLFENVKEELTWEWKDITASDIQNKFIEFRVQEDKILKGVK